MHFAFAITEYFPFGGAQRDFIGVVTAMASRGHQISIITTAWQGEKNNDWQYFLLNHKQKTNHGRMRVLSDYVLELKKQYEFDAVVGFTKMSGLDIYFAADPCFTSAKYIGVNKLIPRYRTYANIEQSLYQNPELNVFYLTDIQRKQYQNTFGEHRNVLLPVCVDQSFFYSEDAWLAARQWRESQIKAKNKIVLLFVAADFKTKGLDRIIRAFEQLDNTMLSRFELWIVGDGKAEQYQSRLETLSQISYRFWGGQAELGKFYLAADYLVHPARKEAAGMVLAEAMAAKLPMSVTDICGYHFLAKDDSESSLLDHNNVVNDLIEFLKNIAAKSVLPARGKGSNQVLNASRAEFCANQIEEWVSEYTHKSASSIITGIE